MQTVEQFLQKQRQKTDFDIDLLSEFLYGKSDYEAMKNLFPKFPKIPYSWNTYNQGRVALMKEAYSNQPLIYNNFNFDDHQMLYLLLASNHQMPGSVSPMMFSKCIEYMGSEEQKEKFLKKSINFEIVGCYAQTEIGHGSDVRSLETTATYDPKTEEFIIHSPSISAAKYWPGQLGLCANWALVYAQLILNGKRHGVQAFFVPIRDKDYNTLPGIEAGDIGPKVGYHAKENGYMMLNKVRIPRNYMLGKFKEVSADGKLITKEGDQRIAYATMMKIRLLISTIWQKVYGQLITIATRYSMFRKQFKGKGGIEQAVIEYQTQQEKLVSRVAEFYAIVNAGHKVRSIAFENEDMIKKGNPVLMQETHIILCFTKALFTEISLEGMEICRRACGGHGYSHYAGFTAPLDEFYTNPTHEGQNTVLYLQVAKYIMKNFQNQMMGKGRLPQSLQYLGSIDFFREHKCQVQAPQNWDVHDFRILLSQACISLIQDIAGQLSQADPKTAVDVFNYVKGSKLQKLAMLHGYLFTYEQFITRIMTSCTNQKNRQNLISLCLLFGCNIVLGTSVGSFVITGSSITTEQTETLYELRESLIEKLRDKLIGLVDALMFPEHLIRSELTHGNPYENYFKLAKENKINQKIPESAFVVKTISEKLALPRL